LANEIRRGQLRKERRGQQYCQRNKVHPSARTQGLCCVTEVTAFCSGFQHLECSFSNFRWVKYFFIVEAARQNPYRATAIVHPCGTSVSSPAGLRYHFLRTWVSILYNNLLRVYSISSHFPHFSHEIQIQIHE
jgi:hypothetical protein